ncbi:GlcG/HbpS family heme-binding protein [Streptomyces griseorubiginosus]|uniref:GlcG/HbpS family heme-binding protein n=1 Tax=Streptomyces griseorubiginosus TaxID=67304 RepID=UPI001AD7D120|nr:heme-binding protein [Streptomyces griseorubiginosus]MBO4256950.1 heme-binding protein [Streptomyces griseorubiginosus]
MREPLTYAIAHGAAQAALEAARAEGVRISVAVASRGGIVKVLLSDDGVGPMGIETARRKAYTAAVTGMPTSRFAQFAASPAMAAASPQQVDPLLLPAPGGLPISVDDGEVIGGVAVGGADGETDERIAAAALASIKDLLA